MYSTGRRYARPPSGYDQPERSWWNDRFGPGGGQHSQQRVPRDIDNTSREVEWWANQLRHDRRTQGSRRPSLNDPEGYPNSAMNERDPGQRSVRAPVDLGLDTSGEVRWWADQLKRERAQQGSRRPSLNDPEEHQTTRWSRGFDPARDARPRPYERSRVLARVQPESRRMPYRAAGQVQWSTQEPARNFDQFTRYMDEDEYFPEQPTYAEDDELDLQYGEDPLEDDMNRMIEDVPPVTISEFLRNTGRDRRNERYGSPMQQAYYDN